MCVCFRSRKSGNARLRLRQRHLNDFFVRVSGLRTAFSKQKFNLSDSALHASERNPVLLKHCSKPISSAVHEASDVEAKVNVGVDVKVRGGGWT